MTGPGRDRLRSALLAVNAVGAATSVVFSVVGLGRPQYVQPMSSASPLTQFRAASSAVRTWAVTAPLLAAIVRGRQPVPQLIVVAGLVQLMDAGLGVWQRNLRMTVLPAVLGVVHLGTARVLTIGSSAAALPPRSAASPS